MHCIHYIFVYLYATCVVYLYMHSFYLLYYKYIVHVYTSYIYYTYTYPIYTPSHTPIYIDYHRRGPDRSHRLIRRGHEPPRSATVHVREEFGVRMGSRYVHITTTHTIFILYSYYKYHIFYVVYYKSKTACYMPHVTCYTLNILYFLHTYTLIH